MLPASLIWSLASGAALVLLGVWVVRLSPRRPANVAIAAFVVATGMRPMIGDLGEYFGVTTWFVEGTLLLISATVLAWLAFRFPDQAAPSVRRAALAGGVVGLVSVLAIGGGAVSGLFNLYLLAFLVPLVALPVRVIIARDPETANRATALASALTIYPAAFAAFAFLGLVDAFDTAESYYRAAVILLAATPVLALLWLYAAHRGPAAASARNVALWTLAAPLLFASNYLYGPDLPVTDIARIATALFLVVAIVRGQLLSTDTSMRWTISRSSIAAVFIAVFFVASETAQEFFGERFESGYLGILAAGVLVFAIAPLSRLADRVAEKAVPVQSQPPGTRPSTDREQYRVLLRRYLGDGRLSRDEELALAHAAAAMGIPADEVLRLRHEAEDERARTPVVAGQSGPADEAAPRG